MTSDDAAATRAANPYLDLPAELHRIINPYIPRPSDLKALCLACKEMRVVAVEFLYRYFEISLDRYTVQDIERLFGEHNISVKSIRALRVPNYLSEGSIERFCRLLKLIPPDQLVEFDSPDFYPEIHHGLFKIIATKQRTLAYLSLVVGPKTAPQVWSEFPWKTSIRKLKITARSKELPDFVIEAIRSYANLKEVRCYGLEWLVEAGKDNRSLGSTIFPKLTSLVLHYTTVGRLTWTSNIVDFIYLVKLNLHSMESLDEFLRNQSAVYHRNPPALRYLFLEAWNTAADSVRDFLKSFTGLHALYINMTFNDDPVVTLLPGILCHTRSLRQLYILPCGWENGEQGNDVWCIPPAGLASLCQNAPHLQQIGLALPDVSMEDAHEGAWESYGEAIQSLALLPKLSLLQIVSWPLPPRETFMDECQHDDDEISYSKTVIPFMLNTFAIQVVRKFDSSSEFPCPIVSFGSRLSDHANWRNDTGDYYHGVYYEPTAYFPRFRKDLYGREERYAIAVDGSEIQYIEPECEVAKFALRLPDYRWMEGS